MDTGDWKTYLPPDLRQEIVNKITENLNKHIPLSGPDGINELRIMGARFEEEIFSGALSQIDYLQKISMMIDNMEIKSQNAAGSASSIPAANNGTSMDLIPINQGHLLPGLLPTNQSQAPQPLLSQTIQNNNASGMTGSAALPSSIPPVSAITREPAMDTGDWKTQLPPDSRQKIINKIMETLKKHIPFSGPDGIDELRRIATRFEEKIFSSAINQTDYLRKLSMKMLNMETKSQNAPGSSIPASNNGTAMNSLPINQGHLLPGLVPTNQSQAPQPLLSHTIQNNNASGMTGSAALPSSIPPVSAITREPAMDTGDWKTQLPHDSRQKIINKITKTLKKHIPFSGQDGIDELRRIAARFEEKIFSRAINQTDYLRTISTKILAMETRSQNAAGSSSSIPAANDDTSMDSCITQL